MYSAIFIKKYATILISMYIYACMYVHFSAFSFVTLTACDISAPYRFQIGRRLFSMKKCKIENDF